MFLDHNVGLEIMLDWKDIQNSLTPLKIEYLHYTHKHYLVFR